MHTYNSLVMLGPDGSGSGFSARLPGSGTVIITAHITASIRMISRTSCTVSGGPICFIASVAGRGRICTAAARGRAATAARSTAHLPHEGRPRFVRCILSSGPPSLLLTLTLTLLLL